MARDERIVRAREIRTLPDSIDFPVLVFSQGILEWEGDLVSLTTCAPRALKPGGWYAKMEIVDSTGESYRVRGARRMHRVGGLLRNVLNPQVRVELELAEGSTTVTVAELRDRVHKRIGSWHGWASGGNADELREAVQSASTARELIEALRDPGRAR